MSGIGRTRLAPFADFAGYSASAVKFARYYGHMPFDQGAPGQGTYGAAEYLAWALADHLVNRHCIVRRAAAGAVRCSGIAERFLDELGRGDDGGDMMLAIWHEASDPDGQRWVGVMRGFEAAALRHSGAGPVMLCHRLTGDTWSSEQRAPQNVSSVVSAAVLPQWRAAIDRARMAGLDLRPGSVTVLGHPARRQSRKGAGGA